MLPATTGPAAAQAPPRSAIPHGTGAGNTSWNWAHPTRGCSQEALVSTGGVGLFYCFAIN